jgi:hypothetical protein
MSKIESFFSEAGHLTIFYKLLIYFSRNPRASKTRIQLAGLLGHHEVSLAKPLMALREAGFLIVERGPQELYFYKVAPEIVDFTSRLEKERA